jgi:hypothetical protein
VHSTTYFFIFLNIEELKRKGIAKYRATSIKHLSGGYNNTKISEYATVKNISYDESRKI